MGNHEGAWFQGDEVRSDKVMIDVMYTRGIAREDGKNALVGIKERLGHPEDLHRALHSLSLGMVNLDRKTKSRVIANIFGTYQTTRVEALMDAIY